MLKVGQIRCPDDYPAWPEETVPATVGVYPAIYFLPAPTLADAAAAEMVGPAENPEEERPFPGSSAAVLKGQV